MLKYFSFVLLLFCVGKSYAQDRIIKDQQQWRLGIHGGIGYMLASTDESEKQLIDLGLNAETAKNLCKDLSRGFSYGADLYYLFNQWIGIGIRYSGLYTETDVDVTLPPETWFKKVTIFDGIKKETVKLKELDLDSINASRFDLLFGIRFYL